MDKIDAITDRINRVPKSESIKKLDIFGYAPLPRWRGGSEKSVIGAIFSLAVIAVMLFYCISTLIRFSRFNPVITTSLEPVGADDTIQIGPGAVDGIDFAIVYRPTPLNASFMDDRYFRLGMQLVTVNEQDLLPRTRIPLVVEPCDFTARYPTVNINFLGRNAFCPTISNTLFGSYADPHFNYLEVNFYLCNNATKVGADCVSEDEMWAKLRGGRLNIMYVQSDFSSASIAKQLFYETNFYLFKRGTWGLSEMFFRKKAVIIQPDYVRRRGEERDSTVLFEREKTYVTDPVGDDRVLTLFLRMDTIVNSQVWNVQTILDLFGTWSAFFATLGATLGMIALLVNTRTFFRTKPGWDEFSDTFHAENAVAVAEKQLEHEIQQRDMNVLRASISGRPTMAGAPVPSSVPLPATATNTPSNGNANGNDGIELSERDMASKTAPLTSSSSSS